MKIYSEITTLKEQYKNIVIALGTFDGIHIGHQAIVQKAIDLAKDIEGTSMVFTFSNHPFSILAPDKCPLKITSGEKRAALLKKMGVDILLELPFTMELLQMPPTSFLQLLYDHFAPRFLISGPNYSFGFRGEGDPNYLNVMANRFGYRAQVQPAVTIEDSMVSSTAIRELIAEGKIAAANCMLGYEFSLEGHVVYGDQRGRVLGFPTANLDIPEHYSAPKNGVYITKVRFDGKEYQAISNVGINPTFKGIKRHLESHILQFSGNLYGKQISVAFLEKLRSEKKFNGVKYLKAQINSDIEKTLAYFSLHSS